LSGGRDSRHVDSRPDAAVAATAASEEIVIEVPERAFEGDDTLSEAAERFIDRHMVSAEEATGNPATWI
jgi:hypothetical protein